MKTLTTAALGLAMTALGITPASAASYVGKLYGFGLWAENKDDPSHNNFNPLSFGDFELDFTIDSVTKSATLSFIKPGGYYFGLVEDFVVSGSHGAFSFNETGGNGSFSYTSNAQNAGGPRLGVAFDFQNASKTLGPLSGTAVVREDRGDSPLIYDDYYWDDDNEFHFVPGSGYQLENDMYITFTSGFVSSSAPEPAAWALMIVGFGAVGGTLRRKRFQARYSMV